MTIATPHSRGRRYGGHVEDDRRSGAVDEHVAAQVAVYELAGAGSRSEHGADGGADVHRGRGERRRGLAPRDTIGDGPPMRAARQHRAPPPSRTASTGGAESQTDLCDVVPPRGGGPQAGMNPQHSIPRVPKCRCGSRSARGSGTRSARRAPASLASSRLRRCRGRASPRRRPRASSLPRRPRAPWDHRCSERIEHIVRRPRRHCCGT